MEEQGASTVCNEWATCARTHLNLLDGNQPRTSLLVTSLVHTPKGALPDHHAIRVVLPHRAGKYAGALLSEWGGVPEMRGMRSKSESRPSRQRARTRCRCQPFFQTCCRPDDLAADRAAASRGTLLPARRDRSVSQFQYISFSGPRKESPIPGPNSGPRSPKNFAVSGGKFPERGPRKMHPKVPEKWCKIH